MVKLLRKTHTVLYYGAVLFFFVLAYPILRYFTFRPSKYYNQIVFLRKWISLLACWLVGIRFKVTFEATIDWTKPYVICPNHTSILDITAINYVCNQPFSFMGKIELLDNPVTNIFFKSIDIAVDRKSNISAFRSFKRAHQLVKEGRTVVIFPEGKIDDEYPPQLHEFKSGSFRIAVENQVQIIPVVLQDAWKILWDDGLKKGSRPGVIHITVLAPIDTQNLSTEASNQLQIGVYHKMKTYWDIYNDH
ncbi:1-acyl-sn-glycerol-3-phosphate acyltransferase [Sphingobacterium olei]|uniref:1-acyl-sn-glycerol-3-phosphate acyltransferase n=1 Tax=Sphingobacterium olei TaxID=2571155 RepID=A0A4U0P1Q9_9SPHI|nr:lysophospholipid acyltransferase family protein [Sphingobacterium olei]TJZ61216.1 1-acyl-sn-glycerol-3-phosphate acyltransferase [Sphingobacterium olei]